MLSLIWTAFTVGALIYVAVLVFEGCFTSLFYYNLLRQIDYQPSLFRQLKPHSGSGAHRWSASTVLQSSF